jgi:hypothetical protein
MLYRCLGNKNSYVLQKGGEGYRLDRELRSFFAPRAWVLKKLLICAKLLFVEATNLLRPSMYDAAVATVRLLVVSLLRGCKA